MTPVSNMLKGLLAGTPRPITSVHAHLSRRAHTALIEELRAVTGAQVPSKVFSTEFMRRLKDGDVVTLFDVPDQLNTALTQHDIELVGSFRAAQDPIEDRSFLMIGRLQDDGGQFRESSTEMVVELKGVF